jgi:hypothetical protein
VYKKESLIKNNGVDLLRLIIRIANGQRIKDKGQRLIDCGIQNTKKDKAHVNAEFKILKKIKLM